MRRMHYGKKLPIEIRYVDITQILLIIVADEYGSCFIVADKHDSWILAFSNKKKVTSVERKVP